MVFKRRTPRTPLEWTREFFYPRTGFRRAAQYLSYRLRRLPDKPHKIARGVFAGVLVSFTPLFGFHFFGAALLAWLMRGNILAALLATFVGNPVTFPLIAITSVELGHWMLGIEVPLSFLSIVAAFSNAGSQLWENVMAIFTAQPVQWDKLEAFFHTFYWPYFIGGLVPGLIVASVFYYITIPVVRTYQKIRAAKMRHRIEKRRGPQAPPVTSGDDDGDATP